MGSKLLIPIPCLAHAYSVPLEKELSQPLKLVGERGQRSKDE